LQGDRQVKRKVAVVLFNLGGPDSLEAVRPFLFNLFKDPAIIGLPAPLRYPLAALIASTRNREASANYAHMGGRSPIVPETEAQCRALEAELARALPGTEARAFMAMRYWKPFTEDAARAVEAYAPDEVVLLPLYPQFSTTTTGSSLKAWGQAYRGPGHIRSICCYPTLPGLARAHAGHIRSAWHAAGRPAPVRLLFSAHGLPEKVIAAGDPYQAQIEACASAIASELGGDWDWQVCYQSRVGPMKWLGPSTPEAIGEAVAEGKGVVVCPLAFVSVHVETLVELDRDYAALAERLGCSAYVRVPALGVERAFISGLAGAVAEALGREHGLEPASSWRCPAEHAACPMRREIAA
jgi:ferrochelatase